MEAIGRLAGGVAHDFNNLLTAINGYVELLKEKLEPSSAIYNDIEEIGKAGKQATNLTRQLLAFRRQQVVNLQVINTNSVIQNMGNMLQRMIGEDIKLSIHLTEDLGSIKADTGQIEQILINLAVNARDAMLTGGLLTIETANVFLDEKYCQAHAGQQPGPYVMLAVSDNGIGMSDEVKERIFEPFFTTKEKGKGTGLGLSTVYGIVKQSTGSIRVYSEPGQGTTFTIYLPRVDEAVETNTSPQGEPDLSQNNETVLVVEDEDMVRELTVRILRRLGYKVIEAHNAEEALQIEQNYQDGVIHLLLTDVVMPNMNGIELAEKLQERHRDLKIIFMSGYTNKVIINHGILNAKHQFIQKPFTASDLASKVRAALTEGQPITISVESVTATRNNAQLQNRLPLKNRT